MDGPTPDVTLPAPFVPNADSNGGIGAIDVEDDAKGIIVRVGPWQGMTTGDDAQVRVRYTLATGQSVSDTPHDGALSPFAVKGDEVTLTWAGQSAEGTDLPPVVQTRVLDNASSHVRFDIPYEDVEVLAQGRVTVSYTVKVGGTGTPLPSARANARIIGEVQRLAAPTVSEAVGNSLDPADGATVIVPPYPFVSSGDRVIMTWDGVTAGGGSVIDRQFRDIGNMANPIAFVVPAEKVAALAGGVVDTYSTAGVDTSARGSVYAQVGSPVLSLNVTGESQVPAPPGVDEAEGDTLDPDKVNATLGAHVLVPAWSGKVRGDSVELTWQGSLVAKPYIDRIEINKDGNDDTTFFVAKVPNVSGNLDGSYNVRRDATDTSSAKLTVSVTRPVNPWDLEFDVEDVLRTAPAGRKIRHLEIRSKDVIRLDFFKFKGKA